MISYLTLKELQNTVILFRPAISLSEKYKDEREIIWKQQLEKAEESGISIWNGVIYTIEEMLQIDEENIQIVLSTCEYKDIVFRINNRKSNIVKKYGISHIPKYITLDCIPITTDGKLP